MSTLPSAPGFREGLARLLRLTRKELSESLRDRRTVITLVLMPLLLYPVLAMAFMQMLQYRRMEKEWPAFLVGFASREEKDALMSYWEVGRRHRLQRHTPPGQTADEKAPPAYLASVPELVPAEMPDVEAAVREGTVDVGVRLRPPGGCEVLYREDSTKGHDATRYLELLTADANAWHIGRVFAQMKLKQRGDPIRVQAVALADESSKRGSLVPVLVPLVLILMTMTGAVYPAIDLTAGERERGTLEILVAAPIPRLSVLLAKYLAVLAVAMLTAIVNIGSMTVTLLATGIGAALFGESLTVGVLFQVLALLALFAAFFSAVLLALTSFARSFKEAQAYLIPLMLFCLMPGVLALIPGLSLRGPLSVAPLINIVLLARDLFDGSASAGIAFIVVVSTFVYALAAVTLAAQIFGTEAVLTGEHGTWTDLFRRPATPRVAAEPAGALLCLAVMFPVYFFLNMSLARLQDVGPLGRLTLAGAANVLLFAGFPLVSAWFGRLRLTSTFRLHTAPWQAWPAAILLGLCLWPFVSEVVVLLRQVGVSTMGEEHFKRASEAMAKWRELSPVPLFIVLALLPAVLEELFFRGYLFSALEGKGEHPGRAIVGTAGLFALFHLLVTDALAVERLLPSLLMGLALGWLAWRSASVLPGILLHVLHNGSIVLIGYYEPWLEAEMGWSVGPNDHLPTWLLAVAGVGALVGLAWLSLLQRPAPGGREGDEKPEALARESPSPR